MEILQISSSKISHSAVRWAVVSPLDSLPAPRLSSLKRTWRCLSSSCASSLCDDSPPPCCLIAICLRKDNPMPREAFGKTAVRLQPSPGRRPFLPAGHKPNVFELWHAGRKEERSLENERLACRREIFEPIFERFPARRAAVIFVNSCLFVQFVFVYQKRFFSEAGFFFLSGRVFGVFFE